VIIIARPRVIRWHNTMLGVPGRGRRREKERYAARAADTPASHHCGHGREFSKADELIVPAQDAAGCSHLQH